MKIPRVPLMAIFFILFVGFCQNGDASVDVKNVAALEPLPPLGLEDKFEDLSPEEQERELLRDSPIRLKPVVQFSCAVMPTPREDALETYLRGKDEEKKLAALKKLTSLSAPSSVALQYEAFSELKKNHPNHQTIVDVNKLFNEQYLTSVLSREPLKKRYSRDANHYYWCIRAVGVLQYEKLVPRLLKLSSAKNLYTNLAAAKSIKDFDGKVAEDALLYIVSCWKYNAYVKAGKEMLRRNPKRFSFELEKMNPPDGCRYQYGLFLARCGNAKAVPHLCATVKDVSMIDGQMFHFIASLGRPEDRKEILELAAKVRKDQQKYAQKCIEIYLERMKKNAKAHKD